MFLTSQRGCSRDEEQSARGKFLALFGSSKEGLWGVVRSCSMHQSGHFMMGSVTLGDQTITVSGTYGGDGLPRDLSEVQPWNRGLLIRMPPELEVAFWAGGGHNSAGSEGPAVHAWGLTLKHKPATIATGKTQNGTAFDSRSVYLPKASTLGYGRSSAGPGCFVTQRRPDGLEHGAVLCAVGCEGEEYVMVPFARMLDGDPYEQLNPPAAAGGFEEAEHAQPGG